MLHALSQNTFQRRSSTSPMVRVTIIHTDVDIDIITYSPAYFKPGIPYNGKVQLSLHILRQKMPACVLLKLKYGT